MKKVRKSIFETNSSSSHSIHIDKDVSLMDTSLVPDENGEISISSSEFGWDWDKLTTAREKAVYCFTDNQNTDMLRKVIKEQTGAKKVSFSSGSKWSGIDHQSQGNSSPAFVNEETLRNLIFNTKSTIYTGNDNGSAPLHFYADSSTGVKKICVIGEDILRERNIDSVLDIKSEIRDSDLNWTYSLDDSDEKLYNAVEEFLDNYGLTGFPSRYNTEYWVTNDINLNRGTVILTKTTNDFKNSVLLDEKEFTILIKDNK